MTLRPNLVVVTDTAVAAAGVLEGRVERACALARPGTVLVQLRDPDLPVRERKALGERLLAIARRHGQALVVNDRIDLALLIGADGVHLGESSVRPEDARRLLSGSAFVSHACHGLGEVLRPGSDAALLSPVVAPRKGRAALGTTVLTCARGNIDAHRSQALLFALGGVDATTAKACIDAGAHGVAVIGAVLDGRDPLTLLGALGISR